MSSSHDKLRSIFGAPGWSRFLERIASCRNSGKALPAIITLDSPTREEREAVSKILRRAPSSAGRLRLDLRSLRVALHEFGIEEDWEQIIDVVCGPVPAALLKSQQVALGWERLWREILEAGPECHFAGREQWLERLKSEGLVRRLFGDDHARALEQLQMASSLLRRLPLEKDELLATFSATAIGDSHALDMDKPLTTLILKGLAQRSGCEMPRLPSQKRELWSDNGVVCDDLSAPVLVLNLNMEGGGLLGELLRAAGRNGMPVHLSSKLLWRTDWSTAEFPRNVYVCENPAVVSLASERLREKCSPIVCVDGNPKTATRAFLHQLAKAGVSLHYHGDFDWPGVAIARRLMDEFGAKPWRFSAEDYEEIQVLGTTLEGVSLETPWSDRLSVAMAQRNQAYHEEAVAEVLLGDLSLNV